MGAHRVDVVRGSGIQPQGGPASGAYQVYGGKAHLNAVFGAAAATRDASPCGDLLDLSQHLAHDHLVQKRAPAVRLSVHHQLVHRLLQLLHSLEQRVLLPDVAAAQPGGGAGQGHQPLVEQCVVGAGRRVILGTTDTGHRDLTVVAHLSDGQLRLPARAGQTAVRSGQLKFAALHHHRLAADGAEIADG